MTQRHKSSLISLAMLAIWLIIGSGLLTHCGLLDKDNDGTTGEDFEGKIPGDWSGLEDWGGSSWSVVDE